MGLSKIGVPPRLVSFKLGSFSTSIMMVEKVFETKTQESLVSGGSCVLSDVLFTSRSFVTVGDH